MIHTCIIAASKYELLRSLKRTLEPDVEVVAMVDNLVSLRDSMLALEPDLVVVNLDLLGENPGRLVNILHSRSPEVGLIVLYGGDDSQREDEARNAGVDRMVLRPRAGSELVPVAKEVLGARRTIKVANQKTSLL